MAEQQKNMIRALNEQKYLRNLQNEFKPKMIFKNQSEKKARQPIILPKSYEDADSSAQTIDGSIFSNDISPFSAYSPFSANSNTSNESSNLTIDDGSMTDRDELNKLFESVRNVGDIFERYKKYKQENENNLAALHSPSFLSRQSSFNSFSDELIDSSSNDDFSLKNMSLLKIDSPRLDSFLNSINLLKPESTKDDKKNAIKRIFVKSPDYTSGEDTDSSVFSSYSPQNTNSSTTNTTNSANTNSASSFESNSVDEKIKIRERKNRVLIKINTINNKKSELVPLKISFFGGSTMTYDDCKKVIREVLPPKDQNIQAAQKDCDTKMQEKNEEIQEKNEEIQKLKDEKENLIKLASLSNVTPVSSSSSANDMGLAQLLNKSLTGTSTDSTSEIGLEKPLNALLTGTSANDMELKRVLNDSLTDTSASSATSATVMVPSN